MSTGTVQKASRYVSNDGTWRVTVISLDGTQRLRVEHNSPHDVPLQAKIAGQHRAGLVQTAPGWWHAGDFRSPAEVERFVPLSELEEQP